MPTRPSSASSPATRSKNPNHWKFDTDQFYFKSPAEMALDFPGQEAALRRTLEIAERCNVEIELGTIRLPRFPVPEGRDAFDYLVELCEKGLGKRYGRSTPELEERLRFELKTIREMGFGDYFLIVWDLIHYARERDPRRPGPRLGGGLGGGLLPADHRPRPDAVRPAVRAVPQSRPHRDARHRHGLRRVAGRDEVIHYVTEKLRRDHVAQIVTFETMMARAAVRDAARVLEFPYGGGRPHRKMFPPA